MHHNAKKRLQSAVAVVFISAPAVQAAPALEEVIITAQRQAQSIQSAGIAVSALSAEAIQKAGVTTAEGLTTMVPALIVQPAAGPLTQFYIRGVGSFQSNAYAENAVAFQVDNVFYARVGAPHGTFYDLERLEVLKGPQGTLYGRNATGGAINVITRKPELGLLGGYVTLEAGNYDLFKTEGAVNVPLGETAAMRFSGQIIDRDGYLSDGYDDDEGKAGRLQFAIEHSEQVSTLLSFDYFEQGGKGRGAVLLPRATPTSAPDRSGVNSDPWTGAADPRSLARAWPPTFPFSQDPANWVFPTDDAGNDSRYFGASATVDIDLDWAALTVIPAWRRSDMDWTSYAAGFAIDVEEDARQKSLELRLASQTESRLEWVAGLFYFDESVDARQIYNHGVNAAIQTPLALDTTSYAAFGQATLHITDAFRGIVGLRYTKEEKQTDGWYRSPTYFVFGLDEKLFRTAGDDEWTQTTWKAGFEYDLGYDSLLYAHVATGFKAGGHFAAAGDASFDPEELTAWTLGSKNRFFNQRLQLNAELFFWKYEDQQISHMGGISTGPGTYTASFLTENVGNAEMKGVEIEFQAVLSPADFIGGSVQYLDTEYTDFTYAWLGNGPALPAVQCPWSVRETINGGADRLFNVNCSGQSAINSPEWTVNLMYEHTIELGAAGNLTLGARARYESERYLNVEYTDATRVDEYVLVDAYATYATNDDKWQVTAYINNIENEDVFAGSFARPFYGDVYNNLRPPRTYGARVSYAF